MAFKSEQKTVSNKLLSQVIYNIPRNQRQYVWQDKNWTELWNDINFTGEDCEAAHFVGSIVLMDQKEREGIQYYDIIDGQQRIISLVLFVAAISQKYKEDGDNDSYSGLKRFLQSTDLRNNNYCKIQSEYQPSIETIVEKVVNSSDTYDEIISLLTHASDKQVVGCFSFFYSHVKGLSPDAVKKIQMSLLRVNYIDITATTQEDSYTIFEILNARGMALEDAELLKNYIMRYSRPSSIIDRVKQEWDTELMLPLKDGINRFLIHYVRHKYKTSGNKISPYAVIKENTDSSTISELFTDLKCKSRYYQKLSQPIRISDGGSCSNLEYRVFKFLKAYRGELFRPLILSLMHAKERGQITNPCYEKLLTFFQYYFTCYNLISQETSNKISGGVQRYANLIENEFDKSQIKEVVSYLVARLPEKKEFAKAFGTLGWSNHDPAYEDSSNKRKVQIALSTIEYIKSGATNLEEFTIEHILPDSAGSGNALIGNLILLEESINKNCKDKTLSEKIPYYKQSNFRSVHDFIDAVDVDTFNPRTRATIMAGIIYDELKNTSKSI